MITAERARELMREAIEQARMSTSEDEGAHPKVGAVLIDHQGEIIERAFRNEDGSGDHAESILLKNKVKGRDLSNATLFVTHEPCTGRGPGNLGCAELIIKSGIKTVYICMLDPHKYICGSGENYLRWSDVSVERFPHNLVEEITQLDTAFVKRHRLAHLPGVSLYVAMQISDLICEQLQRVGFDLDDIPADWDFTIDDIILHCTSSMGPSSDIHEITDHVRDARGIAYDKKYADYTYDKDTRGLGDHWKRDVRDVLRLLRADDYQRRRVINVGIGNGLESVGLFDKVQHLTVADIVQESLKRARRYIPQADIHRVDAEDLKSVGAASQDVYISLPTYQSSYFNIERALCEAYRVIRQGGIVLISIANGFLGEDGALIRGLVIPRTNIVDPNRPFKLSEKIREKLTLWHFEEVGIRTGLDEIYIYGRKGR